MGESFKNIFDLQWRNLEKKTLPRYTWIVRTKTTTKRMVPKKIHNLPINFTKDKAVETALFFLHLGVEERLRFKHQMVYRPNHPGNNASLFSKYLSQNGQIITSDSCLCNQCFRDCISNANTNKSPGWVHLHETAYSWCKVWGV